MDNKTNYIEELLQKSGWTVAEDGKCTPIKK